MEYMGFQHRFPVFFEVYFFFFVVFRSVQSSVFSVLCFESFFISNEVAFRCIVECGACDVLVDWLIDRSRRVFWWPNVFLFTVQWYNSFVWVLRRGRRVWFFGAPASRGRCCSQVGAEAGTEADWTESRWPVRSTLTSISVSRTNILPHHFHLSSFYSGLCRRKVWKIWTTLKHGRWTLNGASAGNWCVHWSISIHQSMEPLYTILYILYIPFYFFLFLLFSSWFPLNVREFHELWSKIVHGFFLAHGRARDGMRMFIRWWTWTREDCWRRRSFKSPRRTSPNESTNSPRR